jgi:hypothetical protein
VEKDFFLAAGKECTEVIPQTVPSCNKGGMGIPFREPIPIHIGEHFRSRLVPEHSGMYLTEHAQFKVLVQDRKMADTFLGMLSSRSWSTCSKS